MKQSKNLWKKLLSAAAFSAVVAVPVMGTSTIARADSHRDRSSYQNSNNSSNSNDNNRNDRRGAGRSHDNNQPNTQSDSHQRGNNSNFSVQANRSSNSQPDHRNYDSGRSYDSHADYSHSNSHTTNVNRYDNSSRSVYNNHTTVVFRGNGDRDDNWHRSHGYVRNGSSWYWHGHDDNWWYNNGYSWNGSLWIQLGNLTIGIGNTHQDYNWHRDHGYVWRGDRWYWHDHDDDYWIDNGYFWNGTVWIIGGNSYYNDSYGPFRDFTGVVTKIDYSDNEFDIRINGNTYNVYSYKDIPDRLYEGDLVRVYGQRYGHNDIRNANFSILHDN